MRSREEIISLLTNPGVIAVIRAEGHEQIVPACEALVAGGIMALEITLTTPNALAVIKELSHRFTREAVIGAGSVTNVEKCSAAIEAGAEFIVSPVLKPEIAKAARTANRIVMLGAFTPTEAQLAHEAGADFVKIFPAEALGADYIKAIRAPLPHLKIIPTGGVDLQTIGDFLNAGCAAVGVGSALVSNAVLLEKNWPALTQRAHDFVAAVKKIH